MCQCVPQQLMELRIELRPGADFADLVQTEDSRPAVAFRGLAATRVIHQDPPHQLGNQTKEMRSVAPLDRGAMHQTQQRLMHERCALKGVIAPFASQVAPRVALQFRVDDWRELTEGSLVALLPAQQHLRHRPR